MLISCCFLFVTVNWLLATAYRNMGATNPLNFLRFGSSDVFRLLMPKVENTFPPQGLSEDTSETVYISALALLKILKQARAGVPLEVLGLLIGRVVDNFTIEIVNVLAMPQRGNAVSVESVDDVYQHEMLEALKTCGLIVDEIVVGWYHSHPGYGCWLSKVDIDTQVMFQGTHSRAVALVIDPVQSVKGKVVLDVFRCVNLTCQIGGLEFRNITSNVGCSNSEPDVKKMLMKCQSTHGPFPVPFLYASTAEQNKSNQEQLQKMSKLVKELAKLENESKEDIDRDETKNFGHQDALKHLEKISEILLQGNILRNVGMGTNISTFKTTETSAADSNYEL